MVQEVHLVSRLLDRHGVHGERLVAHHLAFVWRDQRESGMAGDRFRLAVVAPALEALAVPSEPSTQAIVQFVDGLDHRVGRCVGPDRHAVQVERGLRYGGQRLRRALAEPQFDHGCEHRLMAQVAQVPHLPSRMFPIVVPHRSLRENFDFTDGMWLGQAFSFMCRPRSIIAGNVPAHHGAWGWRCQPRPAPEGRVDDEGIPDSPARLRAYGISTGKPPRW